MAPPLPPPGVPGAAAAELGQRADRRAAEVGAAGEAAVVDEPGVDHLELPALGEDGTRPASVKFGRQLEQLSHAKIEGRQPRVAARTVRDLARMAPLVTPQGTEPFRQTAGAQYHRRAVLADGHPPRGCDRETAPHSPASHGRTWLVPAPLDRRWVGSRSPACDGRAGGLSPLMRQQRSGRSVTESSFP